MLLLIGNIQLELRDYDPIPKEVNFNLQLWAVSFNKELNNGVWSSVDNFKESLNAFIQNL
jgi:hypothetical protein